MNKIESLVTLARRYCFEYFNMWSEKYRNEGSGNVHHYSDSDYNIFPRYNAIEAIKLGIETIVGKQYDSIDQCKSELINLGLSSQTIFTTSSRNNIEEKAIYDERIKFKEYIENISDFDLLDVDPLTYARKMIDYESIQVSKEISKSWNFDGGYWVPLKDISRETVFLNKDNISKKDYKQIYEFIINNSDKYLIMLTEEHYDYEIDKSEFDPDCYETVYSDKTFSWIIYGSHENTLAFGGNLLIQKVFEIYRNRSELINQW